MCSASPVCDGGTLRERERALKGLPPRGRIASAPEGQRREAFRRSTR